MDKFLQLAIEAAKQGDKVKAMGFVKQALSANPNDAVAWLVLAAVVDQPDRKRECLNRVLTLDPANAIARQELLGMDRAAMGATPPAPFAIAPSTVPPLARPQPASVSSVQARPQTSLPSNPSRTKPLVFRMPILTRLPMYFITAVSAFMIFTSILDREMQTTLLFFVLFLGMCLISWAFSGRIEVSEAGILVDNLVTESRIGWDEISEIKSGSFQQGLELKRKKGKSVKVTGGVSGYPTIVEILRQKRADLFGMTSPTNDSSASVFAGTKIYKKSLLMRYSGFIIGFPMLIISVITLLNGYSEFFFVAIFMTGFSIYLISQPLFHAYQIKIEPNRLIFETMFEQKEFSASQVDKIWIKTVRGKYGSAFHYVMVKPANRMAISLRGFGIGEEILYGVLMNWWNTYKNR